MTATFASIKEEGLLLELEIQINLFYCLSTMQRETIHFLGFELGW